MTDEELLQDLRGAARRADAAVAKADLEAPLGPAFVDHVAARILAERGSAEAKRRAAKARRSRVVSFTGGFAGLAAAAALALFVGASHRSTEGADLPGYAITASGGQDTVRGAAVTPTSEVTVALGAPLAIEMRPREDVGAVLDVHAFAVRGGKANDAHAAIRVAPSGAVDVRGTASDLAGAAPGDADVVVIVARSGATLDARAVAEGASIPRGVAVGRVRVHLVP